MYIAATGNDDLRDELLFSGMMKDVHIEWFSDVTEFVADRRADAFIDLQFDFTQERIDQLKPLLPKPVLINSQVTTLKELAIPFIRINALPTFLNRKIMEASALNDEAKLASLPVFRSLEREVKWVPDEPGFISARIVAMIINEAYFALDENVSTKDEIDIAMKLGTNYPYGPFEWSEKIGLRNIYELLSALGKTNRRYEPAAQLKKEALEIWR